MHWSQLSRPMKRTVRRYMRFGLYVGGIFLFSLALLGCGGGGGGGGGNSDSEPPSAPSGLTGTSGDKTIDLNWDGVGAGDLDGYNVYRATSSINDISNRSPQNESLRSSPAFTDDGLTNGTTYYYVVTAVDEAGNESTPSGETSTTPFATPPTRPTN